ncbi:hypothetical protein [Streptomyces sp. LaPpAH-108]|uniref:hypothetical protein n=1 Tax=Streptomyces sp. LaPpAH-108 TaxID=1155714 RepID=UPI0003685837|nr:hypothetical protein [Streptomyces sp. LaPpAH-108]
MRWPSRRRTPSVHAFTDVCESRDAGLAFEVSARVEWRWSRRGPAPADAPLIAGQLARQLVEKTLGEWSVLRPHAAEQDLAAVLRDAVPLGGDVTVTGVTAALHADAPVVAAARRKQQTRHACELDELERRQARARMEFLRDELLADPSSARLYTLLPPSPRLGGPLPGTDPAELDELVRQVHRWHPESRWVVIAQVLQVYGERITEAAVQDHLKILRAMLAARGHHDLAAQVAAVVARG